MLNALSSVLEIIMSTVEGLAIFLVIFSLFKIPYKGENLLYITLMSMIISAVMFGVHKEFNLSNYAPLINLFLVFVFIMWIFSKPFLESAYLSTVTMLSVLTLQGIISLVGKFGFGILLVNAQQSTFYLTVYQSIEIVILLALAFIIKKSDISIFRSEGKMKKIDKYNLNDVLLASMSIIAVFLIMMFTGQPIRLGIFFVSICLVTMIALGSYKQRGY